MAELTVEEYAAIVQAIAKAGNTTASNIISIYNAYGVDTTNYNDVIALLPKTFNRYKDLSGNIYYATQASGAIDITDDILEAAQKINSNTKIPTKEFEYVISETIDEAGKVIPALGAKAISTGSKVLAVGKTVGTAVGLAAAGIALGKTIDKAIYTIGTEIFHAKNMEAWNPDTWGDIVGDDPSFGGKVFNFIFGIDSNSNQTQAYMPQEAFAYLAGYLNSQQFFTSDEKAVPPDGASSDFDGVYGIGAKSITVNFVLPSGTLYTKTFTGEDENDVLALQVYNGLPYILLSTSVPVTPSSQNRIHVHVTRSSDDLSYDGVMTVGYFNPLTYNGLTVYGYQAEANGGPYSVSRDSLWSADIQASYSQNHRQVAWVLKYGVISKISAVPGTGEQSGATLPTLTGTTVEDILAELKVQYPSLFEKAVTTSAIQQDGTLAERTYIPVPMPDATGVYDQEPISGSSLQENPFVGVDNKDLLDFISKIISNSPPENTDTGDGDAPPYVPPAGSASSLFAVYNPSQSELDSFGTWLWSGDLIDQLKKLFNDPMQAIIGLHKVFASPPTSGKVTIKVGFVDSGISANKVSSQYVTIDCGTVKLSEQFQNVFDYSPYTTIQIYLPFVGVVQLDPADVMRGSISVKYGVDVITGSGLAQVAVTRDNAGGILYTYPCNCSVTYPVSSGSYIASIGSAIGGAIRGASVGGVIGGIVGAATGALGRGADIAHSGQFTGNSGAMGIKKPYLIISSPQTILANNFPHFDGKPTNYTVVLGQCTGFTKVLSVHVEGISATSSELDQIESLLKEGVIIAGVSS